jgi:hypothetical protein
MLQPLERYPSFVAYNFLIAECLLYTTLQELSIHRARLLVLRNWKLYHKKIVSHLAACKWYRELIYFLLIERGASCPCRQIEGRTLLLMRCAIFDLKQNSPVPVFDFCHPPSGRVRRANSAEADGRLRGVADLAMKGSFLDLVSVMKPMGPTYGYFLPASNPR